VSPNVIRAPVIKPSSSVDETDGDDGKEENGKMVMALKWRNYRRPGLTYFYRVAQYCYFSCQVLVFRVERLYLLLHLETGLPHSHSQLLLELPDQHGLLLVLVVQQLQLIVDEAVLGALLLAHRALLLQLRRPERLNTVH
jgi:hypothetical protein